MKLSANSRINFFVNFVLVLILGLSFYYNFFKIVDAADTRSFQIDSETSVAGGIVADIYSLDKQGANLGFISKNPNRAPDNVADSFYFLGGNPDEMPRPFFEPYKSQVGGHEVIYSLIVRVLDLRSIEFLQFLNCVLLSIVLISITNNFRVIFGFKVAFSFLAAMILSPWMILFSRLIFWSTFLWFFTFII